MFAAEKQYVVFAHVSLIVLTCANFVNDMVL